MIALTDDADGARLYLNPTAIESLTRDPEGARRGVVVRMATGTVHRVAEGMETILLMVDEGRGWAEDGPRWRIPYRR